MAQGNQNVDETSASSVEGNEDLLVQILMKLPVKHLLRFRSVSKWWLSIIGGQHFRRLHFKSGSSGGIYFLYLKHPTILNYVDCEKGYVNVITHTNLQNLFAKNEVFRMHSCNGLIALVTDDTEASLGFISTAKFHLDFFVYNPATRRCKHIPRPRFDLVHDDLDMDTDYYRNQIPIVAPPRRFTPAKVCPDSRKRFIALNLAFDPLQSDHYKLVYIWKGDYSDRFAIYDSATQVWKDCECMRPLLPPEDSDSPNEFVMYMNGVFWNGDLHWPSYGWSTYCLDLDSGREKPMPPLPKTVVHSPESDLLTGPDMFFFGVADGDLCVIGLKEPSDALEYIVFKMEPDYSKWSVKYCLRLSTLTSLYPSMVVHGGQDFHADQSLAPFKLKVVGSFAGQDNALLFMVSIPGNIIVCCDMQGRVVKEIGGGYTDNTDYRKDFFPLSEWGRGWWEMVQHVETLAPVKPLM